MANPRVGSAGEKQETGPNAEGGADSGNSYRVRVACREIPGKGRGVVALEDCDAGAEVERAPVIPVPASELPDIPGHHTVFDQYLLYWSDEPGAEVAMGCGLLMIYNHSSDPNVEFHTGPDPLTMSVITTRPVKAGEELMYDYDVELWFTPA
jgi:uncharacterized protein